MTETPRNAIPIAARLVKKTVVLFDLGNLEPTTLRQLLDGAQSKPTQMSFTKLFT
jgi:hypothetical protein